MNDSCQGRGNREIIMKETKKRERISTLSEQKATLERKAFRQIEAIKGLIALQELSLGMTQ